VSNQPKKCHERTIAADNFESNLTKPNHFEIFFTFNFRNTRIRNPRLSPNERLKQKFRAENH